MNTFRNTSIDYIATSLDVPSRSVHAYMVTTLYICMIFSASFQQVARPGRAMDSNQQYGCSNFGRIIVSINLFTHHILPLDRPYVLYHYYARVLQCSSSHYRLTIRRPSRAESPTAISPLLLYSSTAPNPRSSYAREPRT